MNDDDGARCIRRCARQRRGIRMVEPSERLGRAYAKKSHAAMRSMRLNIGHGIGDWAASTSYYAMYYAVHSLLMRAGIRCEIHDCTAALFGHLFGAGCGDGRAGHGDLADMLRKAKKRRVAAQYYTDDGAAAADLDAMASDTCRFVTRIEAIADGLDREGVGAIRERLRTTIG